MNIKDDETAERLRADLIEYWGKCKIYNDFIEKLKQFLCSFDKVIKLVKN